MNGGQINRINILNFRLRWVIPSFYHKIQILYVIQNSGGSSAVSKIIAFKILHLIQKQIYILNG
ncbi:hypothetical protein COT50_00710 [candidate division WWE3 bacterium CG08_land_8_20_14_0_20_41_10]|uniref:Uncharacterized protein n=1 Tax=candidate division WWE3 bacterium CG08_land_8_20_14_0_20_41_10 TaxID=1975085 RepID=A0A2H0XCJ8_UNCKA|nr:MAG: hypothetical protein COT50_00710 [candidate division WWE3 bacterium CG08_land_8_20_14_0_20_41_10]